MEKVIPLPGNPWHQNSLQKYFKQRFLISKRIGGEYNNKLLNHL